MLTVPAHLAVELEDDVRRPVPPVPMRLWSDSDDHAEFTREPSGPWPGG